MENENKQNQNGRGQTSTGANVPKGQPQGVENKVKEGDPNQQRPKYGADGGKNTSTREDQLPSIADGASSGSDADPDKIFDDQEDQQRGSDADKDRGGEPSQ